MESGVRSNCKSGMVARTFLGLDDEVAFETRGMATRNLLDSKTLSDLDALIFKIKDFTTVVVSADEVRLFNPAYQVYQEAYRFRFPRKFFFSENLEERVIRKQHLERMKVIRAITGAGAGEGSNSTSFLRTVSFIPGIVDHVDSSLLHGLRECWRTELGEFCATLHQNPNLRNVHIASTSGEFEASNIGLLLNSSLVEISLPELREQGWRDLALGLARNSSLRVLTVVWDAEGMETFVQTRVSGGYDSDGLTWPMCNTTLETLVISCPSEFDVQSDSEIVASMLKKVSCVSTFVLEYYPHEPAPKLTRLARHLGEALMESPNVRSLHLHIPFHSKDVELILKPLVPSNNGPAKVTTLTSIFLAPDRWTKSGLDAVKNMLCNDNSSITQFGIRHLNPKKKLPLWKCLQRIGEPEIVEFLGRLSANSTLQTLSLRGWSVVDGKKVLAAVLGLLRTQRGLEIDLTGTGLASKNMLEPVEAQLQKNRASEARHGSTRSGSSHQPSPPDTTRGSQYSGSTTIPPPPHGSIYITTTGSDVTSITSGNGIFTQESVISEHLDDSGNTSTSAENHQPDVMIRSLKRRNSPQPMYFSPFTYSQVVDATEKFQTPLGEGGFGVVYKGELSNGTKIAVKDLKLSNLSVPDRQRIQRSFEAEVRTLGLIHHVNLVRLLGYCTENDHHMLVYEFMANSSLDKWIFGDDLQRILDWDTRKRVAIGIARGLQYLHVGCNQAIVHLDIKPQNILLDDNLNSKLADFGIAKLVDTGEPLATLTMAQGTRAYMAPEIHQIGAVSPKTDVYSFGILLIEIVRAIRNAPGKEQDDQAPSKRFFPSWAKEKFRRGRYLDAVHELNASFRLIPGFQLEEAKKLMCIAIACIHDDMDRRPDMKNVLLMLEGEKEVPVPHTRNRDSMGSRPRT